MLFLSFDMAAGEWSVQQVTDLVCEFRAAAAQYRVGGGGGGGSGRPLVSTFEGPGWAGHWEAVRRAVPGGLYLVPDWSSLGPGGVGGRLDVVDGAFSWAAWPRAGERRISAEEDGLYRRALRGKSYMMGVSPWFYTSESVWCFFFFFSFLFFFFPFRLRAWGICGQSVSQVSLFERAAYHSILGASRTSAVGQELALVERDAVV